MAADQQVVPRAARQRAVHRRIGDERGAMIVGARMRRRSDQIERLGIIRQNIVGQRIDRVLAAARFLDDGVLGIEDDVGVIAGVARQRARGRARSDKEIIACPSGEHACEFAIGDQRRAVVIRRAVGGGADKIERFDIRGQRVIGARIDRVVAAMLAFLDHVAELKMT